VLIVIDSFHPLSPEDQELFQACRQRRALVVANKSDLAHDSKLETEGLKLFRTSALTGEGIDNLRSEILTEVSGSSGAEHEAGFLTNVRQQRLVEESLTALDAATRAVGRSIPHEMIMLDLYSALRPLDAITGETTTDDILHLIFSSFCIGK
jgi:tRNA modification GTPase